MIDMVRARVVISHDARRRGQVIEVPADDPGFATGYLQLVEPASVDPVFAEPQVIGLGTAHEPVESVPVAPKRRSRKTTVAAVVEGADGDNSKDQS